MVELLAPAGNFESLRAAVLNGANAVYIGGKEFSARQFAGNFDRGEMVEAIRFCHAYGVKVYVTMNTLYRNDELKGAMEYAEFLYEVGADAVIIQDTGFLKLLRLQLPGLEVHGSTQMTVHNLEGVNTLHNMGMKRIVLARELSIKEIEHIAKNTDAEIEVFVHGALCICFSGQCLFSSMIGGRSGNRGRCAQPCRQEYCIGSSERAHYLSPKDLSTLEFISKITETGVKSLKIEGRMKRPEYVAGVISAYRNALENKLENRDIDKVTQLFNRGGFTTYNLIERQGHDMMSYERPKNWGTYLGTVVSAKGKFANVRLEKELNVGDGIEIFGKNTGAPVSSISVNNREVESAKKGDTARVYLEGAKPGDKIYKSLDVKIIKEAEESYKGKNIMRMPVYGIFRAYKDKKITLEIRNESGTAVMKEGIIPELALKTPTSEDRVRDALLKTGDTPFEFKEICIEMDKDIVIPVSGLNSIRREAIEALIDKLQGKREGCNVEVIIKDVKKNSIPKIACSTGRKEIAEACIDAGCDVLFFGGDRLRINKGSFRDVMKLKNGDTSIMPWYGDILLEEFEEKRKETLELKADGTEGALCGNLGMYSVLRRNGMKAYLGKGFNIFNSPACEIFENNACVLSEELNLKQLKSVIRGTDASTMVTVYGRAKLMTSRHCFVGSSMGHGKEGCPTLCKNDISYLTDRLGERFPIVTDFYCRSYIYNSKILCTIEHIKDIIGLNADYLLLNFLDESPEDAVNVVRAFREAVENAASGNYVMTEHQKQLLERLKGNMTKGHFQRGVE